MPVKIIQVGVGIRGSHWVDFIAEHPDTVTVACVDPDAGALERARAKLGSGCRMTSDLDSVLGSTEADAVLIASPSRLHAEHATRALRAGLTVMVEKPLASSVAEASRMIEAARAAGRTLMVAENFRYWPAERTVRSLIRDGLLGEVDHATLVDRRHMPSHTEGPWLASMDYPQLNEIAVHHFDSLRAFFDRRPTRVSARAWNPPWSDYKHGACTKAQLELESVHVQYLGTLTSHRFAFELRVEGRKGELWTNRRYVAFRPAGKRFFWPVKLVPTPPGDGARYPKGGTMSLLNSLRDAVLGRATPETVASDNIWTLAMVEAAKRSDTEGRTITVDEVMRAGGAAARERAPG